MTKFYNEEEAKEYAEKNNYFYCEVFKRCDKSGARISEGFYVWQSTHPACLPKKVVQFKPKAVLCY